MLQFALYSILRLGALFRFKQQHSAGPSGLAICCQRMHLLFKHVTSMLLDANAVGESVNIDVSISPGQRYSYLYWYTNMIVYR